MRKVFLALFSVMLLVACGTSKDDQQGTSTLDQEQMLKELKVDVLTAEDAFEPGVEGKVEIKVTEGDDPVLDADEVIFEIWEHGKKDDSEKIEGVNEGDGIYSLTYTFMEPGYYYVIPHVTARGKHTMPTQPFNVGGVEVPVEEEDGFHTEGFDMHFMNPSEVKVGEKVDLFVQVTLKEEPLESLRVRYEIWNDELSENRTWLDAEETAPGDYTAAHSFAEAGTYQIQIHVEDDEELHEHAEYDIHVVQ